MELTVKQTQTLDLLESNNGITHIFYGGAAGGGKSLLGCYWLLKNCFKYPGSRWVLGREVLKRLKETTLLTLWEVCSLQGITNAYYVYNQQSEQIIFSNGSIIFLKDLKFYPTDPNFDSLGSLEICGAFIDEAPELTWKAISVLFSRCRYKLDEFGIGVKILLSGNPSKGWLYKEFYKPSKEGTMLPSRAFIKALVTDNPYISKDYILNLKSLPKELKERLFYGNFEYDGDPRALIGYDAIIRSANSYRQPLNATHISADIARYGRDRSIIVLWDGWDAYVYAYEKQGVDIIAGIIKDFAVEFKVPNSKIIVDDDGVGGGVVDILRCRGFINNSKPLAAEFDDEGHLIRGNYTNLKSQCYFLFAKMVNLDAIKIFVRAEERDLLIEEMEQIKQAVENFDVKKLAIISKDEVKEHIGRSPDITDALMMRMYFDLKPARIFSDAQY